MEFITKYFKYIMIFLIGVMLIFVLVIAAGNDEGENEKVSGISGGVDIAVMPTKESEKVEEDDKTSEHSILIAIDKDKLTMVLQDAATGKRVTYSYTGGTEVVNRFDDITSVSQLKVGEIVDVEYSKSKKLSRIKISSDDWEYKNATGFAIDKTNKKIEIGNDEYFYTDSTIIASGENIISIDDLENIDVLTLRGKDKQLESIIVTEGHGYVRLDNTTYFEGGFVEIGSKIVELITENMVLAVPAGDYVMTVTKADTQGTKEISVGLNEEIRVNLIDFQSDAVRLGTISFKIEPEGATLLIDGVKKDYSELVDVAYGTHKITVKADGYRTHTELIDVEEILVEKSIKLEEGPTSEEEETTTSKENSSESTTAETTTKSSAKETTTSQTVDYSELLNTLFE